MSIPAALTPFILDEALLWEDGSTLGVLGQGSYGKVIRGTYAGQPVAVKVGLLGCAVMLAVWRLLLRHWRSSH